MAITTDFHSHVSRSSTGQMVQAARARGLRVLGLSEHIFQMQEGRPPLEHMPLEGPLLTFATYIESVRETARQSGFDTRLGLEVDMVACKTEIMKSLILGPVWAVLIGCVR